VLLVLFLGAVIVVTVAQTAAENSTSDKDNTEVIDKCEYPAACDNCAQQVENVIVYCIDQIPSAECVGALIYASKYCSACLCEIIASEMEPGLASSLCPVCPDLDVCQINSTLLEYWRGN